MTKTSFSCFLAEGAATGHPALALALDNIRSYRGNESTADHEIGILRIGDTFDTALLTAYLDWLAAALGAINLPTNLRARHIRLLEILQGSDYSITEQASLRLQRSLATLKSGG